ncbi:unnamed protein product, partial [Adineta steineri]
QQHQPQPRQQQQHQPQPLHQRRPQQQQRQHRRCGSKCNTTLLLSDTNTATVQTLVNSLQSAGLTVSYISGGITTYTGSPDASTYSSIILITGNTENTDMPLAGQQSILNAWQNNGTGVVMTEWAAFHVLNGQWSVLSSLLLATRITGVTTTMSFTLINSGHPIWNGLATSFSTSVTLGYSTLNTPKVGTTIIANCTVCGTPAVIVAPSSGTAGRIVQIAHAGHYNTGTFNWGNDANIVTMMINAVKWSARLI